MGKTKTKPGPKTKRTGRATSFYMEADLYASLQSFLKTHPMKPKLQTVLNIAVRRYLEAENAIQKPSES